LKLTPDVAPDPDSATACGLSGASSVKESEALRAPTMLGVTSERFPRGGAFLMGVIGGAGMLSVYTVIPMIGKVLDAHKDDPTFGFKVMAILPAILILVFSGVYFFDKSRGGYKAEILGEESVSAEQVAAR